MCYCATGRCGRKCGLSEPEGWERPRQLDAIRPTPHLTLSPSRRGGKSERMKGEGTQRTRSKGACAACNPNHDVTKRGINERNVTSGSIPRLHRSRTRGRLTAHHGQLDRREERTPVLRRLGKCRTRQGLAQG